MHTEASLRKKMNNAERKVSAAIQQAVVDVLVHGMKWRYAAIRNDVTESGIHRCINRMGFRSTIVDNG